MGIVKRTREINETIKLNEYKIGDDYANVFANTFKKTKQKIIHLNMRNNKLADAGAKAIISNLTEYITTIDLSWNQKMSFGAYELLGQKLKSTFFRLKKLTLDHNNFSKKCFEVLCEGVAYSTSLTILHLNHNNLENDHAISIANMIRDSSLRMLYIAWNKIRDKGATLIFNELAKNKFIQVFDGSFNSFSSGAKQNYGNKSSMKMIPDDKAIECSESAKALSNLFMKNSSLIHMDLSHNNYSLED